MIQGIQERRDSRKAHRKDERAGRRWGSGRERKRLTKHMGREKEVQGMLGSSEEDRDAGEQEEWRDGGEGGAGTMGAGDGR